MAHIGRIFSLDTLHWACYVPILAGWVGLHVENITDGREVVNALGKKPGHIKQVEQKLTWRMV